MVLLIFTNTGCNSKKVFYPKPPISGATLSPTNTVTPRPSPFPSPTATSTPTQNPKPEFPDAGTMRGEHLTASVSKKWMETVGIKSVSLDPEILEQLYQTMLVHWASTLSSSEKNSKIQFFDKYYRCDEWDMFNFFNFLQHNPDSHLVNALNAYKVNSNKLDRFNYVFDFGQGVTGEVKGIAIFALANEHEYKFIEQELINQNTTFAYQYGVHFDDKALIYFDPESILQIYAWDGSIIEKQYTKESVDGSFALLSDLFLYPLVNGGVSIEHVFEHRTKLLNECRGYAIHEALGCENYYCNITGKEPSNFVIAHSSGKTYKPENQKSETLILTPTPVIITASNNPVYFEDYSIVFSNVEIVDVGNNPFGLSSNKAVSIFFADTKNDQQRLFAYSQQNIYFTDGFGNKIENIVVQSVPPQKGTFYYRYIVYISQPSDYYYLHLFYPEGEVTVVFTIP